MVINNKKALVTGATGFIGANLVRRLVAENCEVHILTRVTSNKWRLNDILSQLHEHVVDLNEKAKLTEVVSQIKPAVIFHLATFSFFRGIDFRPVEREIIKTNLLGTMNLIQAGNNFDYQAFISTGTSSEYGPKNKPMKETDVCQPLTAYAVSKAATSIYVNYWAKTQNKPLITLRPFSPFGPYDDIKRMIPEIIIKALQNQPITVKNPNAVRDYIYIKDLVDIFLKAAANANQFKGEIFNAGSGQQQEVSEVVKKIIELSNSQSQLTMGTGDWNPNESPVWQADMSKTSQIFNWQPKYSFSQGLEETIEWFRENLSLYSAKVRGR